MAVTENEFPKMDSKTQKIHGDADAISDGPQVDVAEWLGALDQAGQVEKSWREDAQRVFDRYRDEDRFKKTRFNILYSNTRTMSAALYGRTPSPDVRRRYRDADPLGRQIALVTERALGYSIDRYDFDHQIRAAVHDYLLAGRGTVRVRYVPNFERKPERLYVRAIQDSSDEPVFAHIETGEAVSADAVRLDDLGLPYVEGEDVDVLVGEDVVCEAVQWDDFRVSPARTWDSVRWVAFRSRMSRSDLVDRFGDIGEDIPLDCEEVDASKSHGALNTKASKKRAEIWEIWDKDQRQVIFVAPSVRTGPLEVQEDPLGLRNFFPVPRPLVSIPATDTLVPKPEFLIYEEQARELDEVSGRILRLNRALKARGIYDASIPEIEQVLAGDDNALIPAQNVVPLLDRGGLDRAIWMMPITTIGQVLQGLYAQREQVKENIYEITGIADILRGGSRVPETATANSIKAQWGSLRLRERQGEIQRLVRDVFRLKAEIIAEQFSPSTLSLITSVAVTPDMVSIMRRDGARAYRIDVETDSTIVADAERDQRAIVDLLLAVTQFVGGMAPLISSGVMPMEVAKALLLSAVRRFRLGREIEDALGLLGADDAGAEPVPSVSDPGQISSSDADAAVTLMEARARLGELEAKLGFEREKVAGEIAAKRDIATADRDLKREIALAEIALKRELAKQETS